MEEGGKLGIDAADTSGFKADSIGVKMVFCMGSAQIKKKRNTTNGIKMPDFNIK